MARKYNSGKFKPIYPEKDIGDVNNICWRSSWELKLMRYFDNSSSIIEWQSEETIVKYRCPFNRNKIRRYFPDFLIKMKNKQGDVVIKMIEVKPYKQTKPPAKTMNKKSLMDIYI